jgi:uncharacterized protein (DUF427 family)
VVPDDRLVEVRFAGVVIAVTRKAKRVLETSHPPTFYFPPESVVPGFLAPVEGTTVCEWKGVARYFDVAVGGERAGRAAWTYPDPLPGFEEIRDHIAFYPSLMGQCRVAGALVESQEGDFYGGWITPEIVGPFKGGAGTAGW